jgi:hypothetical protein
MYLEYIFRKHSDCVPLPRQPIVIPLATVHSQNTFQMHNLTTLLCTMQAGSRIIYLITYFSVR